MTWEAISTVGELIATFLVALSLIYLIIQVRQNSASIQATTNQANLAGFNNLNAMLAENPDLAAVVEKGSADPESMTERENLSYTWIMRSYLNLYLNLYDQHEQGTCPSYLWDRHASELKSLLFSPGVKAFRKIDTSYEDMFVHIEMRQDLLAHRTGLRLETDHTIAHTGTGASAVEPDS